MHIGNYLGLVHQSEKELAEAFRQVAKEHGDEVDVYQTCQLLASWSDAHIDALLPFVQKYSEEKSKEPERLKKTIFEKTRTGSLALLRDLHDLYLLVCEVDLCWIILKQAATGLRDKELDATCQRLSKETERQLSWLLTRIKSAAPQTLIVAE
ncbi:molybdopterin oxidoreductase [Adhaeribacter radiodurans]|uniref:Molybdopterin oxidoreductase n=1 Tax=Adhaeribacter radiodurans TaxID=2745197 RepID=A0A7L7LDK5_9BACT|nr:molybdopterin oxidoreductase [Adhaeribacter radiodurans]QMU30615.1 molybdopterin oxidoreductase [Adhaeribacter radiodurans]